MTEDRAFLTRFVPVLLSCLSLACQPAQVRYAPLSAPPQDVTTGQAILFLLGDGGEENPARQDVLAHLAGNIGSVGGEAGPPVTVVFMGDNIYDDGVRAEFVDEDVEKLRGQIEALGHFPNVRGVFVPGNHDWASGRSAREGLAAILRQRDGIERLAGRRDVELLPDDGCPGPVSEPLGDMAHLVFFDSEWLLREPESECGTPEDFYRRFKEELQANRDRRVIVMSHHPLVTGGPHGGNVAPFQHGPLIYYLSVKAGASIQDRTSGSYSAMADRLQEAFAASGAPPLIQAAGHDHNLQVIKLSQPDASAYQLVSGAAAKSANVRHIEGMRYASNGYGYMRLDFDSDVVRLLVYAREKGGGPVRAVFRCEIASSEASTGCAEADIAGEGGGMTTPQPARRSRGRTRWMVVVGLLSATAVPPEAQAAADCRIGCTVVFGLTSFTVATGTAVTWGRMTGGISTKGVGQAIWATSFGLALGTGFIQWGAPSHERTIYGAGIGAATGALVGVTLESVMGEGDGAGKVASALIGAAAGAVVGGVYGAFSHEEASGAATLLSSRPPPVIGIRIPF